MSQIWVSIGSGNDLLPGGSNWCWLHISEDLWNWHESDLTVNAQATLLYNGFSKISQGPMS